MSDGVYSAFHFNIIVGIGDAMIQVVSRQRTNTCAGIRFCTQAGKIIHGFGKLLIKLFIIHY